MTAASSGVCWIPRRFSVSALERPLDSRKSFFRSIGASLMDSSLRNSEAVSIREALGSEGCWSCSACSSGGFPSGWLEGLEGFCRCHAGMPLDFGL